MKKRHFLFAFILLTSSIRGFAQEDFSGIYSFSEDLGKNAGGTPIQYYYTITVLKKDGQYQAKYMVDGYQMMIQLDCSVVIDGKDFILKFEEYGEDSMVPPAITYKPYQELMRVSPHMGNKYDVTYASDFPYESNAGKKYVYHKQGK